MDSVTMPGSAFPGSVLQDAEDRRYTVQARSIAEDRLIARFVLAAKGA